METANKSLQILREEFERKKKEFADSRSQHKQLYEEKENAWKQLHQVYQRIRELLGRGNALKAERDELTKQIKNWKEERGKVHQEVQQKTSLFQSIKDKGKELLETLGAQRFSPQKIQQEIARLESKIETEVMPFEKEQQLRKRVKELQQQRKELQQLTDTEKERNTAAADVAGKRREAQQVHEKIQEQAKDAQQKHEEMMKCYDEIKKMRKEIKPIEEQHAQLKGKLAELRKKMDELAPRVKELAHRLGEDKKEQIRAEKERMHALAKKKSAEVEEKLKTKKKLSMDDILAFQAGQG